MVPLKVTLPAILHVSFHWPHSTDSFMTRQLSWEFYYVSAYTVERNDLPPTLKNEKYLKLPTDPFSIGHLTIPEFITMPKD